MKSGLMKDLREARINKGLKQDKVAKLIGIKGNTLSNWENGRTEPDIDTLVRLCNIYDIDCGQLLKKHYEFRSDGYKPETKTKKEIYFYEILQEIMDDMNLSIPDVARATGLSDSTIRSILTRKSKSVALEVALKISKHLNISLDVLSGEEPYLKKIMFTSDSDNNNGTSIVSKISENIKKFRREKNIKQSVLGNMLGKAPSVIANWEAGTNRPDIDSIEKLCDIFEIDFNTFFGYVDKPSQTMPQKIIISSVDFPNEAIAEIQTFYEYLNFKYKNKGDANEKP